MQVFCFLISSPLVVQEATEELLAGFVLRGIDQGKGLT